MINFGIVFRILGALSAILGLILFLCIPISLFYQSGDHLSFIYSGTIAFGGGALLWFLMSNSKKTIRKREGYLIVALSWIVMSIIGTMPYIFSGSIPHLVDALFESVSGFTTTGASILKDIEIMPHGILFWRSISQWIGGMGIIVLTVALFPLLGIGGVELFVAESSGTASDKLHPRIRETAKRLWLIYIGLTVLLTILLFVEGMSFFDAMNHSFATVSSGGFSIKNASMAYYTNPVIQYTITIFMFIAGVNFTLIYFGLKGRLKKIWESDEFRAYVFVVLIFVLFITFKVFYITEMPLEKAFRESLFQVVSVITTTGFITADYTVWSPGLTMIFFIMMFLGASAGSTSGGIKLIRHLVFFKNSILEFKRLIHPNAIVPLKLNGTTVSGRILIHIIIFLLLYMILFVIGSILMSIMGYDFMTSVGLVATSLGNVGPGLGGVGPVDNFSWLGDGAKLLSAFLMLLGRLELFTILVLFTPYFWKST